MRSATGAASDAVHGVSPYLDQLANDAKLRGRLLAALGAGLAAHHRVRQQLGPRGIATRLGTDPVLRAQLVDAVSQLQYARGRMQKQHKRRKSRVLICLAGGGLVVAAVPTLRNGLVRKVRRLTGGRTQLSSADAGSRLVSVEQQIEVNAPASAVYSRWMQFEQFPNFMEGVDEVKQLDDTLLHWAVTVAGKKAEWDAKITANDPERRIAWESVDGKQTRGSVSFQSVGSGARTTVRLEMSYTAQGTVEAAGSALGVDERRIRGDLERFREIVESEHDKSGHPE
jgi:uncharacterized membrane protein